MLGSMVFVSFLWKVYNILVCIPGLKARKTRKLLFPDIWIKCKTHYGVCLCIVITQSRKTKSGNKRWRSKAIALTGKPITSCYENTFNFFCALIIRSTARERGRENSIYPFSNWFCGKGKGESGKGKSDCYHDQPYDYHSSPFSPSIFAVIGFFFFGLAASMK